ncbi:MAG TPA: cofactor-independent phosphoglycerate mutase [Bacillota bacterium]|nr:cofactor-independent phosphoglycerate mutase [Bacillota bacterium]HOB86253.1 cofactor-independent phosphoglycerate mutase [Bacillota bacterium]HOP68797.1 cofactor-independent phosphoglycerate mutase [Bacillota bacterium]HPT33836.1 cofactor-independent phosphoglycerate mutase [Bacillota bacterium]HPZ64810.1 cofactor-independent phosphoglycerate mutase [Bacillota bacterium]
MKYVIVLADGAADYPVQQLGGRTPLQAAATPTLDYMAQRGEMGLVRTVPPGLAAGSDIANLSVMGYDPRRYYSGRSPFEAASMGVEMQPGDVSFRCNLVTLSDDEPYSGKRMLDYCAGQISSDEARELIAELNEALATEKIRFYPGVGYRHLILWREGPYDWQFTPPHDISGQVIEPFLPRGREKEVILELMVKSHRLLKDHPVNRKRGERGLNPANSIWVWGEGRRPQLPSFAEKYGVRGAVISAVDLVKGIGICAGLESIPVEGADGTLNTNFAGKARAAVEALLNGLDFVFVHLEAPDECGHRGEIENKVRSLELIDQQLVREIMEGLAEAGVNFKLMFLPDHPTPLALGTHTGDPVPFLIYRSGAADVKPGLSFDEAAAGKSSCFVEEGFKLMDYFLDKAPLAAIL